MAFEVLKLLTLNTYKNYFSLEAISKFPLAFSKSVQSVRICYTQSSFAFLLLHWLNVLLFPVAKKTGDPLGMIERHLALLSMFQKQQEKFVSVGIIK